MCMCVTETDVILDKHHLMKFYAIRNNTKDWFYTSRF